MSGVSRCRICASGLSDDDARGICQQCLNQFGDASNSTTNTVPRDSNSELGALATKSEVCGNSADRPSRQSNANVPGPGQRVGNYSLIRKLGEGGMGTVFEADDLQSGRRVALKLLANSLESHEARGRFVREGRLAAMINHPNSVYVYTADEIDGTPVISMELVVGGTLHDRVRKHGALPVTDAVDAILQVIDGLEACAAAGILHRDVKPSNCFVNADGTVKIGDFGLSTSAVVRGDTHLTKQGSFLGTPAMPARLCSAEIRAYLVPSGFRSCRLDRLR